MSKESGKGTGKARAGEADRPERVPRAVYEAEMLRLQTELVAVQQWVTATRQRVVVVFEGRDAAGKGGTIKRVTEYLNPRVARIVALPAPSDRERGQWYFQRYVEQLPAAGEIALFDRSWYNRAGVERVMGYCTPQEYRRFLHQCPTFERMLVEDGVILRKYWFSVSDDEQERRFVRRVSDPLDRLEVLGERPRHPGEVGRVLAREGRDVRPHGHPRGALVGGRSRRQAGRPAEHDRAPAGLGALRAVAHDTPAAAAPPAGARTTTGRRASCSSTCPTTRLPCASADAGRGTPVRVSAVRRGSSSRPECRHRMHDRSRR